MAGPFDDLIPGQQAAQPQRVPRQTVIPMQPRQPAPQTQTNVQRDQLSAEGLRLDNERKRRELGMGDSTPPIGDSTKTGDDYLKTLPPELSNLATQARLLSDGRLPISPRALASPQYQRLLQVTTQFDPSFDAINYAARLNARKDMTSGMAGRNRRALNTAIGHLGHLYDQIGGTASHGGFPFATTVNSLENTYHRSSGDPGITQYEQTATALASELTQVFRGSGGAEADVNRYLAELASSQSGEQKRAAVTNIAALLRSRLDAVGEQYNQAMGKTSDPFELLDEHARDIMHGFEGGGGQTHGAPPVVGGGQPGGPPAGGAPPGAPPQSRDFSTRLDGPQGNATDTIGLAQGGERRVNDPVLAGVNDHIQRMIINGASQGEVNAYYRRIAGPDAPPMQQDKLREAIQWQRKTHDKRGPVIDVDTRMVPMSGTRQMMNNLSQSPLGAYGMAAGDAVTLGTLDNMTSNPALTRAGMAGVRQQNPGMSLAGTVTGGALMAGGLEAGAAAGLGRLGITKGAPMIGDALFGSGYGAGSADEGSRLAGAAVGAAAGVGGGMAGRAVVSGAGRALTGTRDAFTRALTEKGIPLTIGQMSRRGGVVGRSIGKIEDALESVPILGSAIARRRAEGTEAFNAAAFKDALDPIQSNAVTAIGEEGVEQARAATGGAYDRALSGVQVKADPVFVKDMKRAMAAGGKLHSETAEDFQKIIEDQIAPAFAKGPLTGEEYQAIRQVLRQERAAWKGRPRGQQYGAALRQVEGAMEALVRRRAPGVAESLSNADRAYGQTKVIEDAVGRGINAEAGGVFTPAQLGLAARASGKKYGGTGSTPRRPFFELQRAGQAMLPSKVANSGTAERVMAAGMLPALASASSGAAAMDWIDPQTAALFTALGLPFTKGGQRALQTLMVKRPDLVRQAGEKILAAKPIGGLLGAPVGAGLATQQ